MRYFVALAISAAMGAAVGAISIENLKAGLAVDARLLGECDGRIMAAMEESDFPAGCQWIEPVRFEPEPIGDEWKELEAAAVISRALVENR